MHVSSGEGTETMDRLAALLIALFCLLATVLKVESEGLVYDYYANSCPNAEKIIHDTVYKLYEKKGNIATSLIRYVFHDCFDVRFLSAPNFKFGATSDYMNATSLFHELNDVYLAFTELRCIRPARV